ncbi:MAG: protein kinase [Acidobacteriia bacterium]|nr:protein kinase [Terriglobia bacterium]
MPDRAPAQCSLAGLKLGHYRIVEKIGAGGGGEVYRAHDEHLDREVAIKILPPGTLPDQVARKRFRKEALSLSKLDHPNIATIHDFDSEGTTDFLVMEYIAGETLSEKLSGTLPEKEIAELGVQMAEALAAAHAVGVTHCDLKPDNIRLTTEGRLKILDFGLARMTRVIADTTTESTAVTHGVAGTLPYMAPEQLRGEDVDARTDIYGAGMVLYEIATGRRPFQSDVSATLVDQILHAPPPPPGRFRTDLSTRLEEIIFKCLEKDPEDRYESARQLRVDLGRVLSPHVTPEAAVRPRRRSSRWKFYAAAGFLVLLAALTWWSLPGRKAVPAAVQTSVAVLPFQNLGSDKESDYLRLALPDEVATLLSYAPDLIIRPFTATQMYATGPIEPQRAGRELRVAKIVTGHFAREGPRIRVTLEAIDAGSNRLLWHDTLTFQSDDHVNLEDQMVTRVRQGLVLALARSALSTPPATHPRNEEAYELYLRSIAIPHDGNDNKQGIAMLERSIGLDTAYAPAWAEAGQRYLYDSQYSDGGPPARRRAQVATERALSLDPNLLAAARLMIALRTEAGELDDAYNLAEQLVEKRPESGEAHFGLSYVLRYAGRLEEAGRECDTAMRLDPANAQFRSCAITFELLRRDDRARECARLDAGSNFSSWQTVFVLLAERKIQEAMPILTGLRNNYVQAGLILAYLHHDSPEQIRRLSERSEQINVNLADPEQAYVDARVQSFCQQPGAALRQLRRAVEKNYCSYPGLETDPLLENVRKTPEFQEVRQSAAACSKKFAAAHGLQ